MKNLALIIPCYNEEKRFRVNDIKLFILKYSSIDFYFVNDGSTDGTADFVQKNFVNKNNCYLLSLPYNLGKGNAIRQTILQLKGADYTFYGFIDADFEIPFSQVLVLLDNLENNKYLMAISCRDLKQNLKLSRQRSVLSFIMMNVANKIIGLNPILPDTQCGNKIFRREVLETCFSKEFLSAWLFDIEIFLRFKKKYPEARELIGAVPLYEVYKSDGKSNFKLSQNLKLAKQLLLIWRYYRK